MSSEDLPRESLERILEETNSVLTERYPLEEIKLDDGRTVEVCLARIDSSFRTRIEQTIKGTDVTLVEMRARMTKAGVGYGDKEGKVPLEVKHLGWSLELDSDCLQEKDVLLIRNIIGYRNLVVSFLERKGQFGNLGLWNKFLVEPLLGGRSWEITDMRGDDFQVLGKVVRVETLK